MNVAKVDQNIAYVVMVVYLCCIRLSPIFHLFFQTYIASVFHPDVTYVSHIYCKCFIWMLRMSCNGYTRFFPSVLDVCYKCFNCFGRILQVFRPDITKADLVLHIL
jgi:hypothetical protein